MQPTPKQAERLRRLEEAVRTLDRMAEQDRLDPDQMRAAIRTIADAIESLRILVAQTIDAL
jgi:hypothetical protein